jgi:hypothetical protein
MARLDRGPCLFVLPFLVELGDGGADGEVPGVDREILGDESTSRKGMNRVDYHYFPSMVATTFDLFALP